MDALVMMLRLHISHIEKELYKADQYILDLKTRLYYYIKMGNSNSLKNLWDSSKNLWFRFKKEPPKLAESLPLFFEESAEYINEINKIASGDTSPEALKNAAEELCDVIATGLFTYFSLGGNWDGLESALTSVCLKNDSKTDETHAIDPITGKITRKAILMENADGIKSQLSQL